MLQHRDSVDVEPPFAPFVRALPTRSCQHRLSPCSVGYLRFSFFFFTCDSSLLRPSLPTLHAPAVHALSPPDNTNTPESVNV